MIHVNVLAGQAGFFSGESVADFTHGLDARGSRRDRRRARRVREHVHGLGFLSRDSLG